MQKSCKFIMCSQPTTYGGKLIITGSQFLFGLCSLGFINSSIFTLCRVFLFSFSLLIYKKLKLTRDKTEQNTKRKLKCVVSTD